MVNAKRRSWDGPFPKFELKIKKTDVYKLSTNYLDFLRYFCMENNRIYFFFAVRVWSWILKRCGISERISKRKSRFPFNHVFEFRIMATRSWEICRCKKPLWIPERVSWFSSEIKTNNLCNFKYEYCHYIFIFKYLIYIF